MTGTMYINDITMNQRFEITINMMLNQSFAYGEDINNIHLELQS